MAPVGRLDNTSSAFCIHKLLTDKVGNILGALVTANGKPTAVGDCVARLITGAVVGGLDTTTTGAEAGETVAAPGLALTLCATGPSEGMTVGLLIGCNEGTVVGSDRGNIVGTFEGNVDGLEEEGWLEGYKLGSVEGFFVGCDDGSLVGKCVG